MNEPFAQTNQESTEALATKQLVGFFIGEEMFGVDILSVQEIIRDTLITPIPDAPDFLEGVINLRGNIIPVIDLRKRLKLVQPAQGVECPGKQYQAAARHRGGRLEKPVHPGGVQVGSAAFNSSRVQPYPDG